MIFIFKFVNTSAILIFGDSQMKLRVLVINKLELSML